MRKKEMRNNNEPDSSNMTTVLLGITLGCGIGAVVGAVVGYLWMPEDPSIWLLTAFLGVLVGGLLGTFFVSTQAG